MKDYSNRLFSPGKTSKKIISLVCMTVVVSLLAAFCPNLSMVAKADPDDGSGLNAIFTKSPNEPSSDSDGAIDLKLYADTDDEFLEVPQYFYLHVYSFEDGEWVPIRITGFDGNGSSPATSFCTMETVPGEDNKASFTFHQYASNGGGKVYYDILDDTGSVIKSHYQEFILRPWKVIKKINLYNWLAPVGKTYDVTVQSQNKFERLERSPDKEEPTFKTLWWKQAAEGIVTLTTADESFSFTTLKLGVDNVSANPKTNLNGPVKKTDPLGSSAGEFKIIVAEITPTKKGTIDTSKNLQTIRSINGSVDSPAVITPGDENLTYKWGIYDSSKTGDERYTEAQSNDFIRLNSDLTITGLKETPAGNPVTVWAEVIEPQDGNYWNYPDKIRTTWDVEVVIPTVTANAGVIRYTGRKLRNALTADFADLFTYRDDNGREVTDFDISDKVDSAEWTSDNGLTEFANGSLTPKQVGNDRLSAKITPSGTKYKLKNNTATVDVDVYGYRFTGTTEQTHTKGSAKALDYTIELAAPGSRKVAAGADFKDNGAIFEELERVDIMDKDEKNVICSLTVDGEKAGTDYELASSSVKISLKASYLDTLDVGTYKLIGYFKPSAESGKDVDTLNVASFTVSEGSALDIPGTGESNAMTIICLWLTFISALAMGYVWLRVFRNDIIGHSVNSFFVFLQKQSDELISLIFG